MAFQLVGFLEAKSPVCQLSYHHRPIILQINREMYFYLGLDVKLQQEIYREMRQRAQVQKLSQSNFYFSTTQCWLHLVTVITTRPGSKIRLI